jgi:carbonic anhydrase
MPPRHTDTVDKAEQAAMTPADALAQLRDGNRRFVTGTSRIHDYPTQAKITAKGQYPFATVLACIDSRVAPEVVFDLALGDVFTPRIAGNFVTTELLGSMEFASKVAGSKLIVVLGHTECGAIKGACDKVDLGNLTSVIKALTPAVDAVPAMEGERTSKNKPFVHAVTEANVRLNVAAIRQHSPVLAELEQKGELQIVGALHDIATGEVTFLP